MAEELNSNPIIPMPIVKKKRWYKKWWGITILVFIILTVVLSGVVVYQIITLMKSSNGEIVNNKICNVSVDSDPFIGSPNSKVTIIGFEDFECPYCAEANPIIKELVSSYGDQVQFVYRDFPMTEIHSSTQKAHEAADCANEQGKFWQMHDKLYQNQDKLSVDDLKQYAVQLGLDTNTFNTCLDSGRYIKEIEKDRTDAMAIPVKDGSVDDYYCHVNGTPTWFVNGIKVEGVVPLDSFKGLIDILLAD
ncbi:MAG: DsbA family protein [Patescibacteria group bacterium]